MKKQHLRIQECHFLKSALNLDLTLSDDGECLALLISCGIIDLGAFCVELWSFYCSKRISVPMSYIMRDVPRAKLKNAKLLISTFPSLLLYFYVFDIVGVGGMRL